MSDGVKRIGLCVKCRNRLMDDSGITMQVVGCKLMPDGGFDNGRTCPLLNRERMGDVDGSAQAELEAVLEVLKNAKLRRAENYHWMAHEKNLAAAVQMLVDDAEENEGIVSGLVKMAVPVIDRWQEEEG